MPLRRVKFFTGLFARADDWEAAHDSHVERQRLHNRTMHSPGVVEGLDVTYDKGGLAVKVAKGHAIAPNGREIWLEADASVDVPFASAGHRLFLTLRSKDAEYDWRTDSANTGYSGNARIEETPVLSFEIDEPPADDGALVLAQINLTKGTSRIAQESGPGDNRIDTRAVRRAGSRGISAGLEIELPAVAEADSQQVNPSTADPGYEAAASWPAGKDEGAFHLAFVHPVAGEDGEVSWRFGALRNDGRVEYKLFIRNHGSESLHVRFRVYRLRSGSALLP